MQDRTKPDRLASIDGTSHRIGMAPPQDHCPAGMPVWQSGVAAPSRPYRHALPAASLAVLLALAGSHIVLILLHLIADHRLTGLPGLLAPVVGALAWPMLNKLMLALLHFSRRR